jgi:prepilin peptidase CpaA
MALSSPLGLAWLILTATAIGQFVAIGRGDFMTQKFRNSSVGLLFLTAAATRAVDYIAHRDLLDLINGTGMMNLEGSLILAAVLFVVMFVFWLMRKVGAGDVKLLSVTALLVGFQFSMVFALLLLACTVLTYAIMKQPMLLPERMFREYVASLSRFDRVPFGVPISAAAILTLGYAIVTMFVLTPS